MRGASLAETSALVAVLEQKSFTKAAKLLGLSTPRVSDMVRSLEERLGVRLVERTTRSVAPTAAGERLLERLRPALDEYQAALELDERIPQQSGGDAAPHRGASRGGSRPGRGDPALPRPLSRDQCRDLNRRLADRHRCGTFRRRHPHWRASRPRHDRRADLRGDAFCRGRRPRLSRTPRRTQDAAGLGGARLRPRSPAERRFRSVALSNEAPDCGGSCASVRLAVNDGRFAVRAAIEGVGLLQAPLDYVRADLAAGRLVTVLDDWAPPPLDGMFLYYPSRRQIRPALKALADFFREGRRRPQPE